MALLQLPSAGAIFSPLNNTRKTAHSPCLKIFAHLPESSTRPEKTSAGHAALLTAASFAVQACSSSPALAAELAGSVNSAVPFALAGGGAIAALAAALSLSDPEKRRRQQAEEAGGNEKDVVRNYFDTQGFERWRRIYGETDDVNSVQMDIRQGHAQTVKKVLNWLDEEGGVEGTTIADAGCGTGSLSIPLAVRGAQVSASDISASMVKEAEKQAAAALSADPSGKGRLPHFTASDLEALSGTYHTGRWGQAAAGWEEHRFYSVGVMGAVVACLDVFIHYPQSKAGAMIEHLASLAEERLIISFAPYTLAYAVLKRIGELFPGPSKATRAYLHKEEDVEEALKKAGWQVTKREMTATKFYFSRLLEAVPIKS